jgi:tRNA nucleotidyltransferase (CCA-adding enzyme)
MTRGSARRRPTWGVWRGLLGAERQRILQAVEQAAEGVGQQVCLVGGTVRDLLLGLRPQDLDLVVVGDAPEVARRAGATLGAHVEAHAAFGTAEVIAPGGERLDLASSRREHYALPAASPSAMEPAPLLEDLRRRDFTVNAMALGLGRSRGRGVIDPTDGLADLGLRRLRVLHDRSFHDDPTRALRAARLGARLGLRLEPGTARALANAVRSGVFGAVRDATLAREVGRLLDEARFAAAVLRLQHWGAGDALHPDLLLRGETAALALRLQGGLLERTSSRVLTSAGRRHLALASLALAVAPANRDRTLARLARPEHAASARRAIFAALAVRARIGPHGLDADGVRDIWMDAEPGTRLLAEAMEPDPGRRVVLAGVRRAIDALHLLIRGRDLVAAGVPPGREIRRCLDRVKAGRLSGQVPPDREAEMAFALGRPAPPAGG